MNVLALETTERIGSVAAFGGDNLLFELRLDPHQRTAQSLAPGIRALLEQVAWRPQDVDLVTTTVGPGSFTGVRVGVTAAKTFAYCVGADILGVDTLDAIAAGAAAGVECISAAVDAQRGQVVARRFRRGEDGRFVPAGGAELIDVEDWLGGLPAGTFVAGPVLSKMADRVPDHLVALDRSYWFPSAAVVARLAAERYAAGDRDDLWKLLPKYSRLSAAEEKWNKRGA